MEAEEVKEMLREQSKILKLSNISALVRRDCALMILSSLMEFLKSSIHHHHHDYPEGTIREGLALVLSELGPGDEQILNSLLEGLQQQQHTCGRQQLLDILPYCIPMEENKRNKVTKKILAVFKNMLLKDTSSLVPIIGSLSSMNLSHEGRQEAWNLALVSASSVREDDLPVVVQCLLANVTTKEEAEQALTEVRNNEELLIANVVLAALQHQRSGPLLCETYIEVLEKLSHDGEDLLLLDLVLLLDLYQRSSFKSKVASLMDGLLQRRKFPFEKLTALISTLRPRQRDVMQERMQPALQEVGLFLLLAPVRMPHLVSDDASSIMTSVQDCFLDLHRRLDRTRQEELVRSLLHLGDEVSSIPSSNSRKRMRNQQALDVTCSAVHQVIMAVGKADPSSLVRFKYMLMERLTCEKEGSGHEQVCAILVTLLETGMGGGLDSTELMILLQKLLFSPSLSRKQGIQQLSAFKVARGLTLATCMVQNKCLSANDKECIYQWVIKVLLPSNRRTVQPRVGSNGLIFLSTWTKHPQGSQADVFQHVKMIMANTGLVQMKETYLQRKRSGVILAYTDIPECFARAATNGSKKKSRELLFCVKTFLQYRGLPKPVDWHVEATWIFELVSTYLQQGRKGPNGVKRSKWLPDGWLAAAMELPIFPSNNDSKCDDALGKIFESFVVGATKDNDEKPNLRLSLKMEEDFATRKIQIEDFLQLALALLLSMSVSLAVLSNSYDHLVGLEDSDKSSEDLGRRKAELLNLLKYQLLKVYDLRDKLELLLRCIDALASQVKRSAKHGRSEAESQRKLLQESSRQARMVLSVLLKTPTLLDFAVMKRCLVDETDNRLLLQSNSPKSQPSSRVAILVLFRCQVIQNAITRYYTSDATGGVMDEELVLHCSSFIASLINVPKIRGRKPKVPHPNTTTQAHLLVTYLEYIVCVVDHVVHKRDRGDNDATQLLSYLLVSDNRTNGDRKTLIRDVFDQYMTTLQATTDAVNAVQLVEILALLAQLAPSKHGKTALDACWRMLHTIYASKSTPSVLSDSPAFNRASMKLLDSNDSTGKILRGSIVKGSLSKAKDIATHPMVRRSLLLLWSLLVQPSVGDKTPILSKLIDEIEAYFLGQENMPPRKIGRNDGKKARNQVKLPEIPNLNGATLVVYVELTLHMIVAAFAVQVPAICSGDKSPFSHLVTFAKLFERILTLAEQNLTLFPRRFASLLLSACHQVLEATVLKARQCVDWRQRQPLLTATEKQAGNVDYASIVYLEDFLQGTSCIGIVATFCQRSRTSDSPLGSIDRKVTALLRAAERATAVLRRIALAHNIVPTSDPFEQSEQADIGTWRTQGVQGFHVETDPDGAATPLKRKRRVTPTLVNQAAESKQGGDRKMNQDHEEGSGGEYEWQEDIDDNEAEESIAGLSDDGFGVSGDWGSDESDDGSSSSVSLQLGGGLITVAV